MVSHPFFCSLFRNTFDHNTQRITPKEKQKHPKKNKNKTKTKTKTKTKMKTKTKTKRKTNWKNKNSGGRIITGQKQLMINVCFLTTAYNQWL